MKKYLLLILCLVSSLMASAKSGTCGANLTWSLEDGILIISGTGDMTNYSYSSGPWYQDSSSSNISLVIINEGVTSIGNRAFMDCSGLTSVSIPNSVTRIGFYAFRNCSSLTSVTIPSSVTSIEGGTFWDCSGLTSITIPNSVTSIGDSAFDGCSNLTSITIPNSVTSIANYAFRDCRSLTSVNITDLANWCNIDFGENSGVVLGENYANPTIYAHKLVLNGTEIKDIVIPEGVTKIKNDAFNGCSGLTSVTIPNSVTSIGGYAFGGCYNLTSVTIPNSVTSIGYSAFADCIGLTSITIPNSVTSIEYHAFAGCSSLGSMHVLAITPPTCGSELLLFSGTGTIHVYEGLADVYKASDGWRDYDYKIVDDIPAVRVTSLTLDATRYLCTVGQRFTPQVVSYEPEDATVKQVTWSSSDSSTLTIVPSTGACIGMKDGIVTITATAKDSGHATATATVYVGNVYPEDIVTISASSDDTEMGTVTGGGYYLPGSTVTLTATPAIGYEFQSWSDGTTENPYVFTASESKALVANFVWNGIPRYKIEHVQSGLYLKFDPSVTETSRVNVLSLANEGTLFIVESTTDGYSFYSEEAEEYLTTNGFYSWNPGHSTSPSYWQLEETMGGYYIKKDGSHYCAPDGVTAGQHVYTDKMADNANGAVFKLVPAISGETVGIEAPSIMNDVAHAIALDGRIVKNTKARGLYIVNGKKVLR